MKTGVGPRYDLADVHSAATEGRVAPGGRRYKERLLPFLGDYLRMYEFACAVLLELRPKDFISMEKYESGEVADAYGVSISDALQERFGLEGLVTWYVKFALDRDDDGNVVLMASLHEPDHPLKRIGGTIPIRFKRRNS
jgi:hypothetical protein